MEYAIVAERLVKRFGAVTAVSDVSFRAETGSLFALVGTNGAGKTTTIGCLTTRLRPDGGVATIDGLHVGTDDEEIRRRIGVVFQSSLLDPQLTVRENIRIRGAFYGKSNATPNRVQEAADLVDVASLLDRRYGTLSGGQRRRADIARALIHRPTVLFLDEPTAGLDPASRETVWATIGRLRAETGLTVLLTTHYMEETERADDVCVLDAGQVIATGAPSALRATWSRDELRITVLDDRTGAIQSMLKEAGFTWRAQGNNFWVEVDSSRTALDLLKQHETAISDFEFRHGTMDDVFLALERDSAARRTSA